MKRLDFDTGVLYYCLHSYKLGDSLHFVAEAAVGVGLAGSTVHAVQHYFESLFVIVAL